MDWPESNFALSPTVNEKQARSWKLNCSFCWENLTIDW